MPTLRLLGPVQLDDTPLPDERPTHLLVLLAATPGGCTRAQAAATLWPALDAPTALRNLRKTLHRLRTEGHGALLAAGDRLQLAVSTDWAQAEAAAPADALALMRGPLADGLRDDAGWLGAARERALALWRRCLLAALPALDDPRAEAELERLRTLDPHDEPLARAHLQRLHAAGRRDAFQRVRAAFVRALADDLGVAAPPDLADAPAADPALLLPPAARASGPLIGRDDELEALHAALADPGAAVALRGPGGIGKTRLAAELAAQAARRGFTVVWWRLADAATPDDARLRLAAELGLDDARDAPVGARLQAVPTLLVADNAEHLLAAGFAAGLAALRVRAPALRVVVTSRTTVYGLPEFVLPALDVPDAADPPGAVLRSAAVRLFVERARGLDAGFDARAHAPALGRIARAAGGHALALELAAGRVRHASPDEIASALEAGAGELEPLFAASWQALPDTLRPGWAALAALPPSFDRRIAEAAAGLRPSAFDALAARSLVERTGTRWRLHPLLRHWLRTEHPSPATVARAASAALAMLDARLAVAAHDHADTLAWAEAEHELLAQALRQAVDARDADVLARLVPVIGASAESRGRRAEAMALLSDAASRLAGAPLAVRAPVQAQRALQVYRAGRLDDAVQLAQGLARAPVRWRAQAAGVLGLAAWQRGDSDAARRAHRRAHALALAHGLDDVLPVALNNLALVDHTQGRHAEAEQGYRRVAELTAPRGAHRLHATARLNLGSLLQTSGRAAAACPELEAALALVRAQGLVSIEALVLVNLGAARLQLGELDALRRLLPAMRVAMASGEASFRTGVETLEMLLHVRSGEPHRAWPFARAAWAAAAAAGQSPKKAAMAMRCAEAWAAAGERAQALAWLAWQRHQPDLWADDQHEAARLWSALAPAAAEADAAEARAATLTLDDLARAIDGA